MQVSKGIQVLRKVLSDVPPSPGPCTKGSGPFVGIDRSVNQYIQPHFFPGCMIRSALSPAFLHYTINIPTKKEPASSKVTNPNSTSETDTSTEKAYLSLSRNQGPEHRDDRKGKHTTHSSPRSPARSWCEGSRKCLFLRAHVRAWLPVGPETLQTLKF